MKKILWMCSLLAVSFLFTGCHGRAEAVDMETEIADMEAEPDLEPDRDLEELARDFEAQKGELYEQWGEKIALLDVCTGDIGGDGTWDTAVIVEYPAESEFGEYQKRTVFVQLGSSPEGKGKCYRHDGLVAGNTQGGVYGDPYAGMEISDGLLSISEYGGSSDRWGNTSVFCMKDGELVWHSYEDMSHNTNSLEMERTIYRFLEGSLKKESCTESDEGWIEEYSDGFEPMTVPFSESISGYIFQLEETLQDREIKR